MARFVVSPDVSEKQACKGYRAVVLDTFDGREEPVKSFKVSREAVDYAERRNRSERNFFRRYMKRRRVHYPEAFAAFA